MQLAAQYLSLHNYLFAEFANKDFKFGATILPGCKQIELDYLTLTAIDPCNGTEADCFLESCPEGFIQGRENKTYLAITVLVNEVRLKRVCNVTPKEAYATGFCKLGLAKESIVTLIYFQLDQR